MVREVQFIAGEEMLRGHLHTAEEVKDARPGILILPGFADTAVGPHNMHVAMARALARLGYRVLRFDFRGLGESDGDFRFFTWRTGYADARAALELLRTQPEVDATRLGIVGYSLGGALACQLAAEVAQVQALVLLAPVADLPGVFGAFFTSQHREQAIQQGWSDWLGWPVGSAFLPSLAGVEPVRALRQTRAATLILHGTADSEVPPENAHAYATQGAMLQWLSGADHQFASVVVQEDVVSRSCAWFLAH